MNITVGNPLNYYGPFVPPTFEAKQIEDGGTSKEDVQEMIDDSLENAVFYNEVETPNPEQE